MGIERMSPGSKPVGQLQHRTLSCLYAVASVLVALNVAVGESTRDHAAAFLPLAAVMALIAGILWLRSAHLPARAQPALLMLGAVMVSGMVAVGGQAAGGFVFFYIWAAAQAGLFLAPRLALAHVATYSGLYAVTLTQAPTDETVANWVMASATMAVVAVLVLSVRGETKALFELLRETAHSDHLTGLLNRRGFETRMAAELATTRRTGAPLALIMGDLDHFKTINDTFGHASGDAVLRAVAEALDQHARPGDHTGRLGGEEFGILLPGTSAGEAAQVAQRLRAALTSITTADHHAVTATFGVAGAPQHGDSSAEPLLAADRALYDGKHSGRDRVVVHTLGQPAQS